MELATDEDLRRDIALARLLRLAGDTAPEMRAAYSGRGRPYSLVEGRTRFDSTEVKARPGAYLAGRRSIVTVEILPVKGKGDL